VQCLEADFNIDFEDDSVVTQVSEATVLEAKAFMLFYQ